ncbi:132 kDa protein [Durusdinium trenchii]|uniref:132 kDa protein n=1 Tax=Durusdinium trenchii TaxID=1381693 RepID=A0ABP0HYY2_9DINO
MQMVRLAGIIERSDQSVECGSEEPEDEMFYDCLEPTVWALQGGPIVALDLQQVETEETAFYMIQMVSVPEMEEEKCQVTLDSGADVCRAIPTIPVFYMRAYCNRHTFSTRVEPAKPCLQALADLPDAQTAMLLLRHCQSHVKLTHAMRVTPPHGHGPALRAFDEQVQACLEQIGGLPLTQNTWLQASLAIKAGGLGLRSTALHAPAAYIASITHLAASCTELDPTYRVVPPPVHQALTSYNQVVLPEDQIHSLAPSYQQRDLSATVDKAQQAHLIAATTGEAAKGHLQLVQQPGAGAWLTALPADNLGLHINTHLFRVLLRLRLRLPIAPSDGFCPLCDGVADSFGTTLEYAHVVETEANDITGWGLHGPAAFDFAVSSGLRSGVLPSTVGHGGHAALVYEERKRMHQRTEAQCRAQGLQFLPIVAEGCAGGWGPTAMAVFRQLGSFLAARTGDSTSKMTEQLMQGLSITLQRENARAVVRRLPDDSASFNALSEP